MKAVRLTTAFAVVFGVVLPLPVPGDLGPATWAAEKNEPTAADSSQHGRPAIGLTERIHSWTSRSAADYQELMRRLSQPAQLNPVADAAARLSAGRAPGDTSGGSRPATQSPVETAIGWIHWAGLAYQTVVRGLVVEPGRTNVAEKSPGVTAEGGLRERAEELAKSASDRFDELVGGKDEQRKAADAKTAEDARIAAAKQAEDEVHRIAEAQKAADAKKADDARIAAAKQAEDARKADEARRVAEAQKVADAKKADEARIAAAKQAEETRKADEARRVAEAQKAADAKKADEARIAAAKQAEETRKADEARRVAEAQKAADAKKAVDARIAAAKQAEDARKAEEARRIAETQKAADAKKAEERRIAADRKPDETKLPESSKASATPSRKRTAAQRRANRKERAARKDGPSRKVAVAASRKRAKRGRKKAAEHTCAMAGRRVSVPGRYIVRRGDSLWKIAARHYGKGRHYPVIFRANARRIADPNLIFRCQRIYLPKFRRRI